MPQVFQGDIVMPGEIHGRPDQRVVAVIVRIADQDLSAEIKGEGAPGSGLSIQEPAIPDKPDRIGVPVLFLTHRDEAAGKTDIGIAPLPQPLIHASLPHKFLLPLLNAFTSYHHKFLYNSAP